MFLNTTIKNDKLLGLGFILTPIFLIISEIFSAFCYTNFFWGIDHIKYLPWNLILVCIVFSSLVSIIFYLLNRYSHHSVRLRYAFVFVILVLVAVSFPILKASTSFLGDGGIFLSYMSHGVTVYHSNFIDFSLHALIYNSFLKLNGLEPSYSYSVIGFICGLCFLIVSFLLSRLSAATQRDFVFPFLFFTFSGFTVFYYGYIESYTIVSIFMILYAYSAIKTLTSNSTLYYPFCFFLATVILHQVFILLAPSMLFLFYHRFKTLFSKREFISYIIPIIASPIIFIAYLYVIGSSISQYLEMLQGRGAFDFNMFLPLFSADYSVFSIPHIIDFFNVYLLSSPLSFSFFFLLLFSKEMRKNLVYRFALISVFFLFAFFFFLDPKIGMFRDWDLFSLPNILISVFVTFLFAKYFYERLTPLSRSIIILFLLFHTSLWIFLNNSDHSSAQRFKALVELNSSKSDSKLLAHDYEMLANYYFSKKDVKSEFYYRYKSANSNNSPRDLANVGMSFAKIGELDSALVYLSKAQLIAPQLNLNGQIGSVYYSKGDYLNAVVSFSKHDSYSPEDNSFIASYGVALFQIGRYAEAITIMEKAISSNSQNGSLLNSLGSAYAMNMEYNAAILNFEKASKLNPSDYLPYVNLCFVYKKLNDLSTALNYYNMAVERGSPRDVSFENSLKKKL